MTPEQREELKPCPFCGGSVSLEKYTKDSNMGPRSWWGVKCRNTINLGGTCAIEQNPSGSPEAAIGRWNRRAQVEALTVPKGWKLVPMEPDQSMCEQGYYEFDPDGQPDAANMWRAMIRAAPTIPAIPGTKEGA